MALSDCPKCWDTPCTCGHEYENYSPNAKIQLASVILGVKPELLKVILIENKVFTKEQLNEQN